MPPATSRNIVDRWASATGHLSGLDEIWAQKISRVGACGLRPQRDRFGTLVRSIIGQQISTKVAATIDARLRALAGARHEPDSLMALGEEGLRSVGLSGVKSRYILHLSEAVASGQLPLRHAGRWSDEDAIERLTQVKGIGRWTAEMFLVFALNRPDILSVGDLGIRAGIRKHFGLAELPAPSECIALAEPWRPYRSIAMWYLWRDLDARP